MGRGGNGEGSNYGKPAYVEKQLDEINQVGYSFLHGVLAVTSTVHTGVHHKWHLWMLHKSVRFVDQNASKQANLQGSTPHVTQGEMAMKVGYRRVSTLKQSLDRQHLGECNRLFEEKEIAASAKRPALQEMLSFVRDGDTVIVHSIDRLARNLMDLQNIIHELNDKGVTI